MRTTATAIVLSIVALPDVASACINSIARHFTTYPLDFANFGVVLAALILLKWRGQAKRGATDDSWTPDRVLGPDEHLSETDHVTEIPVEAVYTGPSIVRELAIVAACVIAGIGFGFFQASEVALEITKLAGVATVGSGLVAVAILVSRINWRGTQFVWVRHGLLLFTALVWMIFSNLAYDGYYSEGTNGFAPPADVDITSQVVF